MKDTILTCIDLQLDKLGIGNLPEHINYFKFEADVTKEGFPEITLRMYVRENNILENVEKRYNLVEIQHSNPEKGTTSD